MTENKVEEEEEEEEVDNLNIFSFIFQGTNKWNDLARKNTCNEKD